MFDPWCGPYGSEVQVSEVWDPLENIYSDVGGRLIDL